MSKKNDMIFIGPQAAGKTTLFEVLQGDAAPTKHAATVSNGEPTTIKISAKRRFFNLLRGKVSVIDAGGKMSEFRHYKEWCNDAEKVIIVFNGVELLREIDDYKEGGETSSFLKMVLSQLEEIDASDMYFIATHADHYRGGGSLQEAIQQKINRVNEEYVSLFKTKRYPMINQMRGCLFEVDATDPNSVDGVFSSILK